MKIRIVEERYGDSKAKFFIQRKNIFGIWCDVYVPSGEDEFDTLEDAVKFMPKIKYFYGKPESVTVHDSI